ncbi:MAG TPA: hypothetical protein VN674_13670 [Gemmatimonadales bacterium]|nr:hypothetical protein [Gemmatimonadales bacterium]
MRLPALVLLVISSATPAAAQRLSPVTPRYTATFARTRDSTPGRINPGDHAWEGAKVGAGVLGLGGLGVGYGWCAQGDNGHPTTFSYCAPRALIGGLIGATLGAVIGGFIGSTVPSRPASE